MYDSVRRHVHRYPRAHHRHRDQIAVCQFAETYHRRNAAARRARLKKHARRTFRLISVAARRRYLFKCDENVALRQIVKVQKRRRQKRSQHLRQMTDGYRRLHRVRRREHRDKVAEYRLRQIGKARLKCRYLAARHQSHHRFPRREERPHRPVIPVFRQLHNLTHRNRIRVLAAYYRHQAARRTVVAQVRKNLNFAAAQIRHFNRAHYRPPPGNPAIDIIIRRYRHKLPQQLVRIKLKININKPAVARCHPRRRRPPHRRRILHHRHRLRMQTARQGPCPQCQTPRFNRRRNQQCRHHRSRYRRDAAANQHPRIAPQYLRLR